MKTWHILKKRLLALALLGAFVVTLFAPVNSAEASGPFNLPNAASRTAEQVVQRVSWNSGPQ